MDMKRFFLYAIVIAALALAGCGGNGGTQTVMPDPDPDPTCPDGQTGTPPNCVTPPPPITPPSDELVAGIVTANDKDHSAADPAPFSHMDRPTKTTATDDNLTFAALKDDGTFGDVMIGTNKLKMSEDMTPPSVGRFATGAVFSRTSMDVTDTVYAYETKRAAGARAWDDHYQDPTANNNSPTRGADAYTAITSIRAPTASTTSQKFNILEFATGADNDVGRVTASAKNFASAKFPSGGLQTYTYHTPAAYDAMSTTGPNARGETDIRGQEFDGMFHGISGTYKCTGTCSATTNNRGQVVRLDGTTWTFTPDDRATGATAHMVQSVVLDADYLTFGYWVQKDDEDGTLEIGVGTFVDGSPLSSDFALAMDLLVGTADYEGKAGGKFVRKTLAPDGTATIVDGGAFTADANLKARFGGPSLALNDQFTVIGTIDGFQNADGETIDPNWSVTLEKAGFATSDTQSTNTPSTTATSISGFLGVASGGGPAGTWAGSFYGDPGADNPDETNNKRYPDGIGGEFDAHFLNGHVLGAFGAELD